MYKLKLVGLAQTLKEGLYRSEDGISAAIKTEGRTAGGIEVRVDGRIGYTYGGDIPQTDIATITGLNPEGALSTNGNKFIIDRSSFNGENVISASSELELTADTALSQSAGNSWSVDGNIYTRVNGGTTEGVVISDNHKTARWQKAQGGEKVFTFSSNKKINPDEVATVNDTAKTITIDTRQLKGIVVFFDESQPENPVDNPQQPKLTQQSAPEPATNPKSQSEQQQPSKRKKKNEESPATSNDPQQPKTSAKQQQSKPVEQKPSTVDNIIDVIDIVRNTPKLVDPPSATTESSDVIIVKPLEIGNNFADFANELKKAKSLQQAAANNSATPKSEDEDVDFAPPEPSGDSATRQSLFAPAPADTPAPAPEDIVGALWSPGHYYVRIPMPSTDLKGNVDTRSRDYTITTIQKFLAENGVTLDSFSKMCKNLSKKAGPFNTTNFITIDVIGVSYTSKGKKIKVKIVNNELVPVS